MRWHGGASGKRGRSRKYSESAIQFCLTIKSLFNLGPRQEMGMAQSLLELAGLNWEVPDFSTISRRHKHLAVTIGAHEDDGIAPAGRQHWHQDAGQRRVEDQKAWRGLSPSMA